MLKGKSRDASMIAKKIHQPAIDVMNVKAPPALRAINQYFPVQKTMSRRAYHYELSSFLCGF